MLLVVLCIWIEARGAKGYKYAGEEARVYDDGDLDYNLLDRAKF